MISIEFFFPPSIISLQCNDTVHSMCFPRIWTMKITVENGNLSHSVFVWLYVAVAIVNIVTSSKWKETINKNAGIELSICLNSFVLLSRFHVMYIYIYFVCVYKIHLNSIENALKRHSPREKWQVPFYFNIISKGKTAFRTKREKNQLFTLGLFAFRFANIKRTIYKMWSNSCELSMHQILYE